MCYKACRNEANCWNISVFVHIKISDNLSHPPKKNWMTNSFSVLLDASLGKVFTRGIKYQYNNNNNNNKRKSRQHAAWSQSPIQRQLSQRDMTLTSSQSNVGTTLAFKQRWRTVSKWAEDDTAQTISKSNNVNTKCIVRISQSLNNHAIKMAFWGLEGCVGTS